MMRHLASAQYSDRPAGVETQDVFFWRLAGQISNCPVTIASIFISRPARRREIIICTMCVCTCVRGCVRACHAVFSETTTVTHFW